MLPLALAAFVWSPGPAALWAHHRWDGVYDGDVGSFRMLNLVRDALGLVSRSATAPLRR